MAGIEAGILNVLIAPKLVADFASKLGLDLEKGVGDAGEKAGESLGKKLGDGFTKTGKDLTKKVTAPIVAGFGLLIANSLKVDEAFDTIRAKTGLTGVEAEKLQKSFENVASSVPASFQEVADNIAKLSVEFEGLSGKPLEALSTAFIQLKEVTGQALDEKSFADVAKRFKIPSDQLVGSLDQLLRASQKTGISVNELTGKLESNAAVLTELGYSFSDSIAFIGQLEKSGFDSGQVLVGLRKAYLKAAAGDKEAGKATEASAKAIEENTKLTRDLEVAKLKYNELLKGSGVTEEEAAKRSQRQAKLQTDLTEKQNALTAATQKLNETVSKKGVSQSAITSAQNAVAKIKNDITSIQAELSKPVAGPKGAKASELLSAENAIITIQQQIAGNQSTIENAQAALAESAKKSGKSIGEFVLQSIDDIKKLSAAGDEAAANAKAKELFGRSALEVLQGVKAGAFDFTALASEIQFGTETVAVAFAGVVDFPQQLEIFRNRLGIALQPIGAQLFPVIEQAISAVLPLVEKLINLFTSLPSGVQTTILVLAGLAAAVGPVLVGIGQMITAFVALTASEAASAVAATVLRVALAAIGIGLVIAAIVLLIQNWDTVKKVSLAAIEKIKEGIRFAVEFIKNNWQNLLIILTGPFAPAILIITKNWDRIKEGALGALNAVKNILSGVGNAIAKPFVDGIQKAITFLSSLKNGAYTVVKAVIGFFQALASNIGSSIAKILKLPGFSALAKVTGVFSGVIGKIPGLATGGPMDANMPYLVGEKGPEIVVPKSNGYVLPNNVLTGLLSGSNGSGANYTVNVYNPVAETSAESIPAALRRANFLRSGS